MVNYGGGGVEGIHPRGTIGAMVVGPTPLGPDKIVTVSPGLKVRYVSESGSGLALERASWRIPRTEPALRGGGAWELGGLQIVLAALAMVEVVDGVAV